MGKDIGAIIFLLFIVGQGVAAVVTALKKRQAKAAKDQAAELSTATKMSDSRVIQTDAQRPVQVKTGTPTSTKPPETLLRPTAGRDELIARRRAQIEELKEQARVRRGETQVPTRKAPATVRAATPPTQPTQNPSVVFRPVPEPQPAMVSAEPAEPAEPAETDQSKDVWAISPSRRSGRHGRRIRGAVRSRRRLRDLVILKEVLDPPLALRSDPFTRR